MSIIPEPRNTTTGAIDRWWEEHAEPPRGHMGASKLGHPCDRYLWLSFRWALVQKHSGRMLRLFERGHREEASVVQNLKRAGMDVRNTGVNQRNLNFGSHVKGSCDGVIMSGVPEAPHTPHLLEVKTASKKSFTKMQKEGLEKASPTYWSQVHVYMHDTGLKRCLFIMVCKDNDEIYTERVHYDKQVAERAIERGKRIATSDRMPAPLSTDPTYWQCQWCPFYGFCFSASATNEHYQKLQEREHEPTTS